MCWFGYSDQYAMSKLASLVGVLHYHPGRDYNCRWGWRVERRELGTARIAGRCFEMDRAAFEA
jgi:hypothetical protein